MSDRPGRHKRGNGDCFRSRRMPHLAPFTAQNSQRRDSTAPPSTMKLPRTLTICLLAAGLSARAQEIKVNLPGKTDAAPAPSAPAEPKAAPAPEKLTDAQLFEVFGWFFINRTPLSQLNLSKDEVAAFVRGVTAAVEGKDAPQDMAKAGPQMDEMLRRKQTVLIEREKAEVQKRAGEMFKQMSPENAAFFAKLKENKNIVALPSGLHYEIVQPGAGPAPTADDNVRVHYTGKLTNGVTFDSSADRARPAEFVLGEVIPGWTEGLQKVNKGGKIKLYVPPYLAYGDRATPNIPANSTLVFDVELLEINPAPEQAPAPAPAPTEKK